MAYRTPEQDERLFRLYDERDRLCDYKTAHPTADISVALDAVDAEIETLTTDLDEQAQDEQAALFELRAAVYLCPPEPDLKPDLSEGTPPGWWESIDEIPF